MIRSVLLLCSLVPSTAFGQAPPPPTEPVPKGSGFQIDQPRWVHPERGENIGLDVTYKREATGFGDDGVDLEASVNDAGGYWRILFASAPGPNESYALTFTYAFAISDDERAVIDDAVDTLYEAARAALEDAAGDPDQFDAALREALENERVLAKYLDADGNSALDAALRAIGVTIDTDEGTRSYGVGSTLKQAVADYENLKTEHAVEQLQESLPGLSVRIVAGATSRCKVLFQIDESPEELYDGCVEDLKESLGGAPGNAETRHAYMRATVAALEGVDVSQADATGLARADYTLTELACTATHAIANDRCDPDTEASPPIPIDDSLVAGVRTALTRLRLSRAATALAQVRSDITDKADRSITTYEASRTFEVEGGKQRWFDAATGVVATGIGKDPVQDAIVPLLVSFCPFGCDMGRNMTPGGWKRDRTRPTTKQFQLDDFSFVKVDLGVRTTVLDQPDPRHDSNNVGFLTGASLAFLPIRLSSGLYFYQLATDSNEWRQSVYLGATVDLIHGAEVLDMFGLGSPKAPDLEGS